MKKHVLIAGVNGVGKSTLCQLIPNLRKLPRINPDEILQEFGNWRKPSDMLAAGKIAIERISTYLENGIPIRLSKNIPSWFEKHILNK